MQKMHRINFIGKNANMRHTLPLIYFETVAKHGSIRSAAEELAITASALNRRIISMEEELGVELFERHSNGVRLNIAGEIFIQHTRRQRADLERVRSSIADLMGMRSGHVRIAATREVTRYFLPTAIADYRNEFPGVTFDVNAMNREDVEQQLVDHHADIIVVFQPTKLSEVHTLIHSQQNVHCVMSRQHSLASDDTVQLSECTKHHLLLSKRGEGVRELIENAAVKKGLRCEPTIESNDPAFLERVAMEGGGLSFAIPIGISQFHTKDKLVSVQMNETEVEPGFLFVGQLRNRTLPVAAAKFVESLRVRLGE